MPFTTEVWEPEFPRWYRSLPEYEQAVLDAAIEHILERFGPDICKSEYGKSLGEGLYEFRVRQSLQAILKRAGSDFSASQTAHRPVLLRVFCTFYGERVVLLLHGLNKGEDSSGKRQDREIATARNLLKKFKAEQLEAQRKAQKHRARSARTARRHGRKRR